MKIEKCNLKLRALRLTPMIVTTGHMHGEKETTVGIGFGTEEEGLVEYVAISLEEAETLKQALQMHLQEQAQLN